MSIKEKIKEEMEGLPEGILDGIPYHFEKYIPTKEELQRFRKENKGDAQFSKGVFLYRIVPFTK